MTLAFLRVAAARPSRRSSSLDVPAPAINNISVVVPVRNNSAGIARLEHWWASLAPGARARELIIVDDGSIVPVTTRISGCRVVRTVPRGPAHARNVGWRAASGGWNAFTDSDCVPDPGWPATFATEWSAEVAIQGRVRAAGTDLLSRFYDSQGILKPMVWTSDGTPTYFITANALVARAALDRAGGFNETFKLAAGEDVDLGLRIGALGPIGWAEQTSVSHDFEPTLSAFIRRFIRYGRGNRRLAVDGNRELASHFEPRPFLAESGELIDHVLAGAAFVSLAAGWLFERLADAGRAQSSTGGSARSR